MYRALYGRTSQGHISRAAQKNCAWIWAWCINMVPNETVQKEVNPFVAGRWQVDERLANLNR